jgi:hypothetical protein
MKPFPKILLLLLGASAAGCASPRPTVSVDLPVASRYVFRGAVIDDNAVFQPGLRVEQEVGEDLLGAGLWSSFELGDDRGLEGNFTEYDVSLDYSKTFGRVDASVGASLYEYPHTDFNSSVEVFAMFSLNDLVVTPTFETWYDCVDIDGVYFNFNLSKGFELAEAWTASAVAGIGWMDEAQAGSYFGVEESGFSDALLQATLEHAVSEHVTLSAVAAFASVLDGDYRDAVDRQENAWFAVGATFIF